MKKILLCSIFIVLWSTPEAITQEKFPNAPFHQMSVLHPGRPASAQEALNESKSAPLVTTYWMLDSTWYSNWIVSSSQWFVNEKNFLFYNNSGALQDNLYTVLNTLTNQWNNLTQYVYNYGASGSTVSYLGQTWYMTGGYWVTFMYYHFNAYGETDTSYYLNYDQNNNNYSSGNKSMNSYNSSNQVLQSITQSWDTLSHGWINSYMVQYSYQASGQMAEQLTQTWDSSLSIWMNSQKTDYSYDASGFATGYISYNWYEPSSQWNQNTQAIYTNSTSGLPLQKLYQQWNSGTNNWENSTLDTYQYNTNNQVVESTDQSWNSGSSSWVNNWMQTNSYFHNGGQDTMYQYYWDPNNSSWLDTYYSRNDSLGYTMEYYSKSIDWTTYTYISGDRFLYFYNSQNQPTEYQHYTLNILTNNWDLSSHHLYTYDGNGNNTVELDQIYNDTTSSYENEFRADHFYSFTTSIFENHGQTSMCYYSNPLPKGEPIQCRDLQSGKDYKVNLYSLKGQIVYSTVIHTGESLFLPETLTEGVYFLQISGDGQLISQGKIILTN
jgi:hypothetical protein